MRRREFIAGLGAAAWPLAAWAQPPFPVVGFLGRGSPEKDAARVRAFNMGLSEHGYIDGKNVIIEYRWAEDQNQRFAGLAADLVLRRVAIIVAASGTISALAAKQATTTIPVVFLVGNDPVELGLVKSMNRPEGNLTGVASLNVELGAKKLELLSEMVPGTATVAILIDPTNPNADAFSRLLQGAARALGQELRVFRAATDVELDAAFHSMSQLRVKALVIGSGAFFTLRSERLASLTTNHALPAVFQSREFATAGGLMSYAGSVSESLHLLGGYTGRILHGERIGDLPVQQSTKIELVLNLKTAKSLGITVPPTLLARADEVIE